MIGGVWMTRATPAPPARLEVLESCDFEHKMLVRDRYVCMMEGGMISILDNSQFIYC